MKFHALLVVRDEADILEQSLRHLLNWADTIHVFDTGSVDQTWDIVRRFAAEDARVMPVCRAPVFFSEKRVRGWLFNQARGQMREGDWFARVDADEFHHIAPPTFVATKMHPRETLAFHQYYDFRLTEREVQEWEHGGETWAERQRPIEQRRRWFTLSSYTEPRLCRYRPSMQWPETVSFPHNAGFIARERLPIRHYPHRDPRQLQRRCRLRSIMMADLDNASISHWNQLDWREHVVPDNAASLHYWRPGDELPCPGFTNHLAPFPKRMLQYLIHAHLLSVLDARRAAYAADAEPRPIPPDLQNRLSHEFAE